MKKLLLLSMLFIGCDQDNREPMIVVRYESTTDGCQYVCSTNGVPRHQVFIDAEGKFKIGDTLYITKAK